MCLSVCLYVAYHYENVLLMQYTEIFLALEIEEKVNLKLRPIQGGIRSKLTKRKMTFLPSSLKIFSLLPASLNQECSLLVILNSLHCFPVFPSSLKTIWPWGARWRSGIASDSESRGPGYDHHRRHRDVSLGKTH